MPEAAATPATPPTPLESPPDETVVQVRRAVQERTGALNDWAHDQARALATTAKERPLAAAGLSAGAAFAAGLIMGLLLARAAAPPEPSWTDRLSRLKPDWRF